jgi:penicillin-binding protein 1A
LPNIDELASFVPNQTTKILARDGSVLADLHEEENRSWVALDQISAITQKTVVAIEDVRFFQHHGLDFKRIASAALVDILHGQARQGASTLTQQLARNVYLSHEKTVVR